MADPRGWVIEGDGVAWRLPRRAVGENSYI